MADLNKTESSRKFSMHSWKSAQLNILESLQTIYKEKKSEGWQIQANEESEVQAD